MVLSRANVLHLEALTVIVRRITTYMRFFICIFFNYGSPVYRMMAGSNVLHKSHQTPCAGDSEERGDCSGGVKELQSEELKTSRGGRWMD